MRSVIEINCVAINNCVASDKHTVLPDAVLIETIESTNVLRQLTN